MIKYQKIIVTDPVYNCSEDFLIVILLNLVITTLYEPIPGWCSSAQGPIGSTVLLLAGVLRTAPVSLSAPMDLVCADCVVNSTMAVAWDINKQ